MRIFIESHHKLQTLKEVINSYWNTEYVFTGEEVFHLSKSKKWSRFRKNMRMIIKGKLHRKRFDGKFIINV
jgi:hypothetical protein